MMFRANDRATGGVMKRNDWILITVVLAVSAIFLGIHFSRPQQKDGMAEVTIGKYLAPGLFLKTVRLRLGMETVW